METATGKLRRRLIAGVAALLALWAPAQSLAAAFDPSQYKSPQAAQRATLPLTSHIAPTAGFIGIRAELNPQGELFVAAVAPESPAGAAGVRGGDGILAIDGRAVATPEAFRNLMRNSRAGQRVKLSLLRHE